MQTLDNSITVRSKRNLLGRHTITSGPGHGARNPTWIPVGNEATRRVAEKINGVAGGSTGEIANIPMTAHFIGGAALRDTPETGVLHPFHPPSGHHGHFVLDGASPSATLGVNTPPTLSPPPARASSFLPKTCPHTPTPHTTDNRS